MSKKQTPARKKNVHAVALGRKGGKTMTPKRLEAARRSLTENRKKRWTKNAA